MRIFRNKTSGTDFFFPDWAPVASALGFCATQLQESTNQFNLSDSRVRAIWKSLAFAFVSVTVENQEKVIAERVLIEFENATNLSIELKTIISNTTPEILESIDSPLSAEILAQENRISTELVHEMLVPWLDARKKTIPFETIQKIEEIFYEGLTISNPRKSPIHVVALELLALSLLSFMNEVHSLRRVDGEDAFIFRMQLGRKFFVRALVKLDFQSV